MEQSRETIRSFHDLEVWQYSRPLVKDVYLLTHHFPKEEIYCLTQQMRKCAISIPSNIAEGHSRRGVRDYLQFISMAIGSAAELETQIILAQDLEYITADQAALAIKKLHSIQRMLHRLRQSLQK